MRPALWVLVLLGAPALSARAQEEATSSPAATATATAAAAATPRHRLKKIGEGIADKTAQSVGVAEMAGVRYPVKPYQEQVSPTFWRGSRLDAAGFADLKTRGFRATVDLTKEGTGDDAGAPAAGLHTLHLPILDNSHPSDEQMQQFLQFVTDSANQPVYVHCEAGVGRTSIATAVYQMAVLRITPEDALAGARSHGMKLPNQKKFILRYGADLAAGKVPGYPPR